MEQSINQSNDVETWNVNQSWNVWLWWFLSNETWVPLSLQNLNIKSLINVGQHSVTSQQEGCCIDPSRLLWLCMSSPRCLRVFSSFFFPKPPKENPAALSNPKCRRSIYWKNVWIINVKGASSHSKPEDWWNHWSHAMLASQPKELCSQVAAAKCLELCVTSGWSTWVPGQGDIMVWVRVTDWLLPLQFPHRAELLMCNPAGCFALWCFSKVLLPCLICKP